jgi:NAD(P)-dependent dehydrogenase (short-subunit alcohol dehydrogenase family)
MPMPKKNAVIITGADSGIGTTLAKLFIDRGWAVISSCLNKQADPTSERQFMQRMDITVPKERTRFIAFCAVTARRESLRIRALVNNAGIALGGPVEDLSLELYRSVFEVNFFGLVDLTRQLIPLVRENHGRIIIAGSLAGRIASPFLAPYAASKFALEGFTDSLRRELKPQGIPVIMIRPAGIATPIWERAERQDLSFLSPRYRSVCLKFMKKFIAEGKAGMPVDRCAERIYRVTTSRKVPPHVLISTTMFLHKLLLLLPAWLVDRLIIREFGIEYEDQ